MIEIFCDGKTIEVANGLHSDKDSVLDAIRWASGLAEPCIIYAPRSQQGLVQRDDHLQYSLATILWREI